MLKVDFLGGNRLVAPDDDIKNSKTCKSTLLGLFNEDIANVIIGKTHVEVCDDHRCDIITYIPYCGKFCPPSWLISCNYTLLFARCVFLSGELVADCLWEHTLKDPQPPVLPQQFSISLYLYHILFFHAKKWWWYPTFLIFTPTWENDPIWRGHIFQMGGANHQLD